MALTYGFFHAHRQEITEGGVTKTTYDRAYNADDLNKNFDGLVAGTGVYMQSNINASGTSMAVRLDIGHTAPIMQDLPDDLSDNEVQVWDIVIRPGSGRINHHWFKIDSDYHVYIPINGGTTIKYYQIGLILDENNRTISVKLTDRGGNRDSVNPVGGRVSSNNSIGYEPASVDGLTEIVPGYVEVKPGVTAGNIKCYHLLGTWKCPYISHLVLPKGDKSAELFVQQYQDEILEWIEDIKEGGGLNQKLDVLRMNYGGDGVVHGVSLDLTYDFYRLQGITYRYSALDTFMVYYNGLYLIPDVDYSLDEIRRTSGTLAPPAGMHCIINLNNNRQSISVNDILSVIIIKGSTVTIPNGNNIKY